ncbi:hypothetical protein SERLA73DRAFT_155664 [Serpula lacrymans var. lacrymans S7.3]|uniref:Uncharacterized protein n=1 Tax=Serpula lacrymans var. lacrymans (strain S7.3) TaxID=936435 RepID=F8QAV2_SERL3|nr:hypothetical protein SERLA73DRAFT_155664 [Serpula lacrymans var. lacrymans S7.3]
MRSFNSLTVLCTIAFSFTSAAPLSSRQSSAVSGVVNEVNGLLGEVPGTSAVEKLLGDFGLRQLPNIADPEAIISEVTGLVSDLGVRQLPNIADPEAIITEVTGLVSDLGVRSTPASVAVVFTQVFTTLTPYVEKLQFINAQNATVADITPVVAQIKTTLTGAVTQIQQLKGQPASVILAGVNGATSISVADLAKILAADLCAIITEVTGLVSDLGVRSTPASVAVVFTQVFTTLTPYVEKLQFINAQNATVADITPVVAQIKTTLTGAVTQIQQLKGQPASVILAGVNGATSISVADLAKILAADLCILFTAVGAVLKVVSTDAHAAVASLLVEVATVIGTLLQAVCAVVTGLAAAVLPLLTTSVQTVIKDLGVSVLVAVLGITA